MCVIIQQPKGSHLEKELALKLWNRNSDGGGFLFIDDMNQFQIVKHMDFTSFWKEFERCRSDFPRRDFLLHMRIATQGDICLENTHPFEINPNLYMAHNGHISSMVDKKGNERSDTRIFVEEILRNLPSNFLDNPWLCKIVEEFIGYDRALFYSNSPELEYDIYRFGSWEQHAGLYLSNLNGVVEKKSGNVYNYRTHRYWWEDTDDIFPSALPASPPVKTPSELEREERLKIQAMRKSTKEIIWLNSTQNWECLGCDEPLDAETGECYCFAKICIDCWEICADCKCQSGYSFNSVFLSQVSADGAF